MKFEIKIKCLRSQKSEKLFYALFINGVIVSIDTNTMLRICPMLSYNDIYLLNEGEEIMLMKGDN